MLSPSRVSDKPPPKGYFGKLWDRLRQHDVAAFRCRRAKGGLNKLLESPWLDPQAEQERLALENVFESSDIGMEYRRRLDELTARVEDLETILAAAGEVRS